MATFISFAGQFLTFDATTKQEYTEAAEVTDHPIESGGFVSDHRQDRPMILEVEGIISESPLEGDTRTDTTLLRATAGERGFVALRFFQNAKDHIFTFLSTRLGTHSNLILQEIKTSVPNTASTKFSLSFKQVAFPLSQTVAVPPEFIPKKPAEPVKVCGEQGTTDVTGYVATPASIVRNADDITRNAISDFTAEPFESLSQIFGL